MYTGRAEGYRAFIDSGTDYFKRNQVRLVVMNDNSRLLLVWDAEGNYHEITEGEDIPQNYTVLLPEESLQAVYEAIGKKLGEVVPSVSEIRVLRESLDIERARVDKVLESAT